MSPVCITWKKIKEPKKKSFEIESIKMFISLYTDTPLFDATRFLKLRTVEWRSNPVSNRD